jgi:hypothetical protein
MRKPCPRVRVLEWGKGMRLKRRFEVRICSWDPFDHSCREELDEEDEIAIPIARFAKREAADSYAVALRAVLKGRPR